MMYKASVLAALSSIAFVQGQTVTIPDCATPCLDKTGLSCDIKELSCLCPNANSLTSNTALVTCLASSCTTDEISQITSGIASDCASYTPSATGSATGSATTTATVSISGGFSTTLSGNSTGPYGNGTTTSVSRTTHATTATTTNGGGASGTTTGAAATNTNGAGRSDFGMTALGLALAAALAL